MDNLPPPVRVTKIEKYSEQNDPPMVDVKVTNPVTYFKKWVGKLLNNQDIDIRLKIKPFATIGLILAFTAVGGTTFSIGRYFFPNSSPVLHRAISLQGTVQRSETGQNYLSLQDGSLWSLKPVNGKVNLVNVAGKQVTVKGNLTAEANVINVSEVIVFQSLPDAQITPIPPNIPASQRGEPNTPDFPDVKLPQLFTGLKWESSQKKILLFTSGKRRIEVEGFHLESSQQSAFPQEFINYYIADLKDKGFKETLNSIDPDGITVTYSNNEIFMTFGVKNIYTGKGDVKKISGYKAFIEHN